jgi:hypothetical protein
VSTEQRENLDAILRQSAFPFDSDGAELRRLTREYASAQPLPAGVTVTAAALATSQPPRPPLTESNPAILSCTSTAACT